MKIEHIAMYVKNLERAKTFFEKYLETEFNCSYLTSSTNLGVFLLLFTG